LQCIFLIKCSDSRNWRRNMQVLLRIKIPKLLRERNDRIHHVCLKAQCTINVKKISRYQYTSWPNFVRPSITMNFVKLTQMSQPYFMPHIVSQVWVFKINFRKWARGRDALKKTKDFPQVRDQQYAISASLAPSVEFYITFRWFIRHHSSVVESAALKKCSNP